MREVITGDDRVLAVEEWGVPNGRPVLYVCGSPMSRLARYPDETLFQQLGVRLITYDRPGFGNSTAKPGRQVADAAEDITAIVDALNIDRLPVFGVSGGGPHALAFAALRPERVLRVASLAALAARDAEGLDWTGSMMDSNRKSATAAAQGRDSVAVHLAAAGSEAPPQLPPVDRTVLAQPGFAEMISTAFAEATRPGLDGWVDDVMALFGLPWGFDPSTIDAPTRLWHGEADTVVPVSHGKWLAQRMPAATVEFQPEAGHAGHFAATPAILSWLVEGPPTTH